MHQNNYSKTHIWIFNHYATNQYFDKNGRHYNFAINLVREGYDVTVFCANTVHNSTNQVEISKGIYLEKLSDNIRFIFIKTCPYQGNGIKRIENMYLYFHNLLNFTKSLSSPDVIIGSSMHILACEAALKIKKRNSNCKVIVEMRDLWTESLIDYEKMSKRNPLIKVMFWFEKSIYKRADTVIFTMPGGYQYIQDMGWDKEINKNKIFNINNGIDILKFEKNKKEYSLDDKDLKDTNTYKIVYTGSMRKANCVDILIKSIGNLSIDYRKNIVCLLFGDGDEKKSLEEYCKEKKWNNIKFKGNVEKNIFHIF